jgi:RpiR family transcriptional regulator, carbohydrate utilization regulator
MRHAGTRSVRSPRVSAMTLRDRPAMLLDRIEGLLDEMRPSEQLVGRYVLRHPNLVISLSFPEIAARAGVSQPTVARFCIAAGFEGYRDFKLRLAKSLANGVPFIHQDVAAHDSMADVGAKVFDRSIAALLTVRNHLDPGALERATQLLASAERIEIYGLGNSGIVAADAQHKFFRLGVPVVAYSDPHVHAMSASLLGKHDVVLAISGTGQTRELIRSVEIARDAGASVIAITASGSDLDVYAPMTTRMVHLVMIDVLAVGLAMKKGPALTERLKRAKAVIADRRVGES